MLGQYVGLVVIVITMIAAIATNRCVSVANKYWVVIYCNPKVLHQLSGLDVQAIYRVKTCATDILLG